MIRSIAFFVYPVADVARARTFYEQTLGLKLSRDFRGEWLEYDLGDTTFAITTLDVKHQPGAHGGVVAFEVDELDSFAARLKERGVKFVREPFDTPVCRIGVVADPDGNEVMIHKRHPSVTSS